MRGERISGLDGLRAVAIALVVAFHLHLPLTHGGWFGVDIFFVVSGYLITRQLLDPDCRWRVFMLRRLARVWPALLVMVAGTALIGLAPGTAALAAATFLTSPWIVLHAPDAPEFVFTHTWTLAVELQFYLAWSGACLRLRHRRRLLGAGAVLVAVAGVAVQAWTATTDPSTAYFAPWCHCAPLFLGAALAIFRPRVVTPIWLAITGVLVQIPVADQFQLGGLLLGQLVAVVFAASVIAAADHGRRGPVLTLLDSAPARWLGERSYSLYLWHPVLRNVLRHHGSSAWWLVLAASLVAADLSYRHVERPARARLNRRIADRQLAAHAAAAPNAALASSSRA